MKRTILVLFAFVALNGSAWAQKNQQIDAKERMEKMLLIASKRSFIDLGNDLIDRVSAFVRELGNFKEADFEITNKKNHVSIAIQLVLLKSKMPSVTKDEKQGFAQGLNDIAIPEVWDMVQVFEGRLDEPTELSQLERDNIILLVNNTHSIINELEKLTSELEA